jgi:hypothetical protein
MFSHTNRLELKYVAPQSQERDIAKSPKYWEKIWVLCCGFSAFGQKSYYDQHLTYCNQGKINDIC